MLPEADIENLKLLLKILESDIKLGVAKLNDAKEEDKPFYSRSYIRAYASWVEGTLHMHKSLIANHELKWHTELPVEYQLYLFEADWHISSNGIPKLTGKKIRTRQNIKAFFVVASELFSDYEVDFGNHGWENILYFYDLRDVQMHPEQASALDLSMDKLSRCDQGRIWLSEQFGLDRDGMLERNREGA